MKGALAVASLSAAMSLGCGSSPPSAFFALSPETGAATPTSLHAIKLRRPAIAGYLDRPEIVERVVDHRLAVGDTARWAAPLDEMLGRVLAQDLEQRLAGSVVFTEDGAITAPPEATLEVDVRRLDLGASGRVGLDAEVSVEEGRGPPAVRAVHLSVTPRDAGTPALVAAMSALIGELADEVANLVRSGAAGASSPAGPVL